MSCWIVSSCFAFLRSSLFWLEWAICLTSLLMCSCSAFPSCREKRADCVSFLPASHRPLEGCYWWPFPGALRLARKALWKAWMLAGKVWFLLLLFWAKPIPLLNGSYNLCIVFFLFHWWFPIVEPLYLCNTYGRTSDLGLQPIKQNHLRI